MRLQLRKKTSLDLLALALSNSEDADLLGKILLELKKRTTGLSRQISSVIDGRIQELEYSKYQPPFPWPNTDAPIAEYGSDEVHFWYKEGLLSFVGYRVGLTRGVEEATRRDILDCVMANDLPGVVSPTYMLQWADPYSPKRLRKLAESIAAFTRNAKRKDSYSMQLAIADWEADLDYLYDYYYRQMFDFPWPLTDI